MYIRGLDLLSRRLTPHFLNCSRTFREYMHLVMHANIAISKPDIEPILQPLHSILSSNAPDERISEELVEMIGFDEIELAMDLLKERRHIAQEVSELQEISDLFTSLFLDF